MNNEQEKLNTSPDEVARLEAEFAQKRTSRNKRTLILRAVIITVLVSILAAIVYFSVHYRDKLDPESLRSYVNIRSGSALNTLGGAADVVGGNSSVYGAFENGLAVASTTSVRYATPDGKQGFSHEAVLSEPSLAVNSDYLLAYDRSGKTLMLFDRNGLISSAEAAGEIISATVSPEGVTTVVSEADNYISCLTVYNKKFEQLYRWYNSEYYVISSAYHDDSLTCGVSVVYREEGNLAGRVLLFDITREGIAHVVETGLNTPIELWATESGFTVSTDKGVAFVDISGELSATHNFSDPIYSFCPDGNGGLFVVLSPFSPDEKYTLVHVNSDGILSRRVSVNTDIFAVHSGSGYLGILSGKDVTVYNTSLDAVRIISTEPDIINIAVMRDGLVVLFSNDGLKVR